MFAEIRSTSGKTAQVYRYPLNLRKKPLMFPDNRSTFGKNRSCFRITAQHRGKTAQVSRNCSTSGQSRPIQSAKPRFICQKHSARRINDNEGRLPAEKTKTNQLFVLYCNGEYNIRSTSSAIRSCLQKTAQHRVQSAHFAHNH